MFWDCSNYLLHLNLSEYMCNIKTGCKSGIDHISSIIVILNNTSNKKVQTEKIETGCKSGLDDESCEENNQMAGFKEDDHQKNENKWQQTLLMLFQATDGLLKLTDSC